jgi:hypothetical protein
MRENGIGDGVFIDLMRTGGFVILEVDEKNDHAISLHLVSRKRNGDMLVESNPVDGEVSATLALELIAETADFVDVLFSAPINASALESKFDGSHFPQSHDPDEDEASNLFAVPSNIEKIGADPGEIRELALLLGAIETWPIRYALSIPLFPTDQPRAIDTGTRKLVSLSRQFTLQKKGNPDVLHMLQDLKSIRSSDQLRNRASTLRRFSNFLEQKLASIDAATTFDANRSVATIPWKIGYYGPPDNSYAVMTSSGIMVGWKVSSNATPVVTRMGLAGD